MAKKQASGFVVWLLLLLLLEVSIAQSGDGMEFGDDEDFEEKTKYVCENSTLTLTCPSNYVIRIKRANYGRFSLTRCNPTGKITGMNVQCQSVKSRDIVATKCDGHDKCEFLVSSELFGDPCPGTTKYVEVKFTCETVQMDVYPEVPMLTFRQHNPWDRFSPPTPENVTVCHHPESKGSVFDIYWTMPSSQHRILRFSLKYMDDNDEYTSDINANSLGNRKYAYILKPEIPCMNYRFAIRAFSADSGFGDYSSVISPRFCLKPEENAQTPSPTVRPDNLQETIFIDGERFCPSVEKNGFKWPQARPNEVVTMCCPKHLGKGTILYKCLVGAVWDPNGPESGCVSDVTPTSTVTEKTTAAIFSTLSTTTTSTTSSMLSATNTTFLSTSPSADTQRNNITDKVDELLKNLTSPNDSTLETSSENLYNIATLLPGLSTTMVKELDKVGDVKKKRSLANKYKESVVNISSMMLMRRNQNAWRRLSRVQLESSATSLLTSVETAGLLAASTIEVGSEDITRKSNIVMKLMNVNIGVHQDATLLDELDNNSRVTVNQITIRHTVLKQFADKRKASVPVVLVVLRNLSEWLTPMPMTDTNKVDDSIIMVPPKEPTRQIVNSDIISASISNQPVKNLTEPVTIMFQHRQTEAVQHPKCAFWDTVKSTWSEEGCQVHSSNNTHTVCQCKHLTSFAVIMDVTGVSALASLPAKTQFSLEMITYIGCTISIICLLLSWLTFFAFKSLDCDRNTIHKHLVFCLMLAQTLFLLGVQQTKIKVLCAVIAGFLHFLFMAAFAWMCLEGVQLYIMLVEVFESERSRVMWYYLFGYGLPVVVVAVSAGVFSGGYGSSQHCWLTTERSFIWSFVGPALGIMLVNICMLSIAIYIMVRHSSSSQAMRKKSLPQKMSASGSFYSNEELEAKISDTLQIPTWIKGALVLVVLLGLTWVFGVLYLDENTVIFAYLFTLLNSLQGLFIFVFHCLMNEKVQKEYRRIVRHTTWLPQGFRIRYGGSASSESKEPSSSGNVVSRLFRRKKNLSTSGSSSNNSAKPFLHKEQRRISSSVPSSSDGVFSSQLTSDTSNNNRKSSRTSASNSNGVHSSIVKYSENNGIMGDLSEVNDCSVVDSEFVSEYCERNLQVSAEAKRYSSSSSEDLQAEHCQCQCKCNESCPTDMQDDERDVFEEKDQLAALSVESLTKHHSPFISTSNVDDIDRQDGGCDGEESDSDEEKEDSCRKHNPAELYPLLKYSDSEKLLIKTAANSPTNTGFEGCASQQSPSLKNIPSKRLLNEADSQDKSAHSSVPNLIFKPERNIPCKAPEAEQDKEPVMNSLPNLNLRQSLGKTMQTASSTAATTDVKRHSSDSHMYFTAFRFPDSDC